MPKPKTKVTLSRFVSVMSGGMVALEDGASGPRAKAHTLAEQIEAQQAALQQLGAPSQELQALIDTYYQANRQAVQLASDKQQQLAFIELETATKKALATGTALYKIYEPGAQAWRAQIDRLHQSLQTTRATLAPVAPPAIKAALLARLDGLETRLNGPLGQLRDASELATRLADLQKLQADLAAADFARYVGMAGQLGQRLIEANAAVDLKLARAAQLPASRLRTLLEQQLAAAKARLQAQGQAASLLGLVESHQAVNDIAQEAEQLDATAMLQLAQQYQDLLARLLIDLQQKNQAVLRLPSPPLQLLLKARLAELESPLLPIDSASSLDDLRARLQAMRGMEPTIAAFQPSAHLDQATRYEDLLQQAQAAFDARSDEAAGLPDTPIRTALFSRLAALHVQALPLAQLTSLEDLSFKLNTLAPLIDKLNAFKTRPYLELAGKYQTQLAELLLAFDQKAAEINAQPASAFKTLLETRLETLKGDALPLDQIATMAALESALKRLANCSTTLGELVLAERIAQQREHAQLVHDLPGEITARVQQIAGTLGAGPQAALTDEFMQRVDAQRQIRSLGELPSQIQALKGVRTALAKREVKTPTHEQAQRLQAADGSLRSAQGLVAKLPDGPLRQASDEAVRWLETTLDQLKVGTASEALPTKSTVGHMDKSGYSEDVPLSDTERTRALDAAIKAVTTALNGKDADAAQLLAFEGGKKFAEGLCTMNVGLVAFGASHKGITPVEALAVRSYTGDDYSAMNRQRRGLEADPRLALLNKICDQALSKMPAYPDEGWPSFRAERAWSQDVVDKRYGQGRQFTCGVLWSTGARGVADIPGSGTPTFTHVIYGRTGRDVAALSANPHEGSKQEDGSKEALNLKSGRGEVLFAATTNFLVTGRALPPGTLEPIRFNPTSKDYDPRIRTTLKEVPND